MMGRVVLLVAIGVFLWLLKRDMALRSKTSQALWVPTLWVGIIASRSLSSWLGGVGGATDALEGSPLDRIFYLVLIVAAWIVLSRRGFDWREFAANNKALVAFYGYFLLSVIWSSSPFPCFKRWIKDFGNIIVLLVILTDPDPRAAVKAVFVRCGYLLLPLSVIFLRYFPALGRRYGGYTGGLEVIGVTFQKNLLGVMVLCTGLVLIFDLMDRPPLAPNWRRGDRLVRWLLLALGIYLLRSCDSKTSIVCFAIGALLLLPATLAPLQRLVPRLGLITLVVLVGFAVLDSTFEIKKTLLALLGRNVSLTGRTDVWRELMALNTDPIFGVGFCTIWSDKTYLTKLPDWVAGSAHNGYLETYLDGGMVGVLLLLLILIGASWRANRRLRVDEPCALFRFAVLVVTILGNFSESHFGRMSPLGFLFFLTVVELPSAGWSVVAREQEVADASGSLPVAVEQGSELTADDRPETPGVPTR